MKKKVTKVLVMLVLVAVLGGVHSIQTKATDNVSFIGEASNLTELQHFIAGASDGDNISIKGEIDIPSDTVIGDASKQINLIRTTGNGYVYVQDSTTGVLFQNVVIDGGDVDSSFPMVDVAGSTEFNDVQFINCTNGAVMVENMTSTFNSCTFKDNKAGYSSQGAHVQVSNGGVILNDCNLTNGTVTGKGGAVLCGAIGSTCSLNNCTITGNKASYGGGLCGSGTFTIKDSLVYGNTATESGSDVYIDEYGSFVVNNSNEELKALYEAVSLSYDGLGDEATDEIIEIPATITGAKGLAFRSSEMQAEEPTPEPPASDGGNGDGSGSGSSSNGSSPTNTTYNQTYNPTINNNVTLPTTTAPTTTAEPVQATATVSDDSGKAKTYEASTADDGSSSLEIKEGENTITININVGTAETNGTGETAASETPEPTTAETVEQASEPLAAGATPEKAETVYITKSVNWVDVLELLVICALVLYLFRDKLKVKLQGSNKKKE